jgi:hypothetical protein
MRRGVRGIHCDFARLELFRDRADRGPHIATRVTSMRLIGTVLTLALACVASTAQAQTAPPAAAGAAAAPPQPAPPTPSSWHHGDPVPPGYHVEEQPRGGLVTAGYIVAGIPYFFSVVTALAANSNNESGWLYVPLAGPWITLGRRGYSCNADASNQTTSQSLACVADIFVVMGLVFDGIVQATGGTLLLVGYTATKPGLVRNDDAIRVLPMHVGTGVGAGVFGSF